MQRIHFIIPCKAFSINAAYYASRKVKTVQCRDWEGMILAHLRRVPELHARPDFKGEVSVNLTFFYPSNIFWTKEHVISSKTFDLSNVEKLLIDVIFGTVLQINDKNIRRLHSEKHPGAAWAIEVVLELNPHTDTEGSIR